MNRNRGSGKLTFLSLLCGGRSAELDSDCYNDLRELVPVVAYYLFAGVCVELFCCRVAFIILPCTFYFCYSSIKRKELALN